MLSRRVVYSLLFQLYDFVPSIHSSLSYFLFTVLFGKILIIPWSIVLHGRGHGHGCIWTLARETEWSRRMSFLAESRNKITFTVTVTVTVTVTITGFFISATHLEGK
jgi:hypothetical protein